MPRILRTPMPSGKSFTALAVLALALLVAVPSVSASSAPEPQAVSSKTFSLFANQAFVACARGAGMTASVTVTVTRGGNNDSLTVNLAGFKPHLGFDLFTVQRTNQGVGGAPVPGFTNFGLAWYQSDIHTGSSGTASVNIKTILLDQIFGFDPDASLAPTNTFHLGFWFDSTAEAQACSATPLTPTPFNGEHKAGPLAFISRANSTTGLGPLCSRPIQQGGVFSCEP